MSSGAVSRAEVGMAADGQTKAEGLRLMEAVVEGNNLWQAYERVMRNKGAAGGDGLSVADFNAWLQQHWPSIKPSAQCMAIIYHSSREPVEQHGHAGNN